MTDSEAPHPSSSSNEVADDPNLASLEDSTIKDGNQPVNIHARRLDHATVKPLTLAIGALGVVYGDIGTSPLYAIRDCLSEMQHSGIAIQEVTGVLSLIFWAILLVVVFKYLTFIMRADNHGEGGILALVALLAPRVAAAKAAGLSARGKVAIVLLGLFGAGLLYGDGAITPAISVLSAIEGVSLRAPALQRFVVPLTIVVLCLLFLAQRFGTAGIGKVFGPIMLVWFVTLGLSGAVGIAEHPAILLAANPLIGWHFLTSHGFHGFLLLGAVVLAITGGEALYADMGHFGRKAIRWAWYGIAMPGLVLNYFGQAAHVLAGHDPQAAANPFYALTPGWLLYPMIVMATAATVIASQALITGVFSLTQQAMQLGFWPRARIIHTSVHTQGQIYIPALNICLMISCLALVVFFGSSSGLAAAYGIAVTGTMTITSLLYYVVAHSLWHWPRWKSLSLVAAFLIVDLSFFGANLAKVVQGGWLPLLMGLLIFIFMTTWNRGRRELNDAAAAVSLPIQLFVDELSKTKIHRVPGNAVFMTSRADGVPLPLLHHFKHNKVLHQRVVLLSILAKDIPFVEANARVQVSQLGAGFWSVMASYGFMQSPDMLEVLDAAKTDGLELSINETSFFLGRETILPTGPSKMPRWRKYLFIFLARNARAATTFFHLPPNRVIELGAQVEL